MRPLNVGDVVSAAISLFRTNFGTYIGLNLKSVLWFIVPIYGWARGLMIQSQIARLGFQELMHQPETVAQSLRAVEPRLWPFLGVGMLVWLIQVAVGYAVSFVMTIVMVPISVIGGAGGDAAAILSGLLMVGVQLVVVAAQMWVQARLYLWNLILAMEPDTESTTAITRSWELTQGNGVRVLFSLLVAYLVMLPLYALMIIIPIIIAVPFLGGGLLEGDVPSTAAILGILFAILVFLALTILIGILTAPFFQTIKSVLYYDLRSRREGMDIQFRDRPRDQRDS
ncbi:MAG: DUF975 domain-containing protein [Leptolyngbya sp. SIOISBB]|nr:DUF975 domain-containing protein [Leptolyngbya sp. SIOISBB]